MSINAAELIGQLSQEELKELKELLGVRKARAKKEPSPEFIAAKAELDAIIAENEQFIQRYEDAKEKLRGTKGVRKVLATTKYNLDKETGVVSMKDSGETVCTYSEDGWQSAMRARGFTVGQCAAVAKTMRAVLTA